MKTKQTTAKTVLTLWNKRTYDVWGNKKDGYEVNDSYSQGTVEIRCKIETHNKGTPQEFNSAYPSDFQLRQVFGVNCHIDTDGDDTTIYVNRASDSYPIGELFCESHESLSPIRKKPETFLYYINLDERGSFSADVRNTSGETIFEIKAGNELGENESSIFDDGFMKDKNDLAGLTTYLRSLNTIGQSDKIVKG
jgi:hypothetical protein